MPFDINQTLLAHLETGANFANWLRFRIRDLPAVIGSFFAARSDIHRLHRAQEVAGLILNDCDFSDFNEIRALVARQELRRLMSYPKQRDHTAHTLNLYLLGVWLFDNVPALRNAIKADFTNCYGITGEIGLMNEFHFLWPYCSLLHDVGYAFADLTPDTVQDRERIDSIYSFEWIQKHSKTLSPESRDALKLAHVEWSQLYAKDFPAGTSSASAGNERKVLERLAYAPWAEQMAPMLPATKDTFHYFDPTGRLEKVAVQIALDGLQGAKPMVDHAVASGLLLFQYASYWYWLVVWLQQNHPKAAEEVRGEFRYSPETVGKGLLNACRATAFHNLPSHIPEANGLLQEATLSQNPLLLLQILCDEIQIWDRFPAGSRELDDFPISASESTEPTELSLSCDVYGEKGQALLAIHQSDSKNSSAPGDKVKKVKSKLSKIPDYSKIIEVVAART